MKRNLLIYSLPVLLVAMMLYGYGIKDHPNNFDQSPTNENLLAPEDNIPVINSSESSPTCTYGWTNQTSATTASQLLTVSAVTSKIAWASGVGPTVIKTTDGGTSWTLATGTGIVGDVYNIWGVDKDTALCTTSPGATFIYKTINGGATWTQVFTQAGGFIDAIQMISPSEGYALGDPVGGRWTILNTTDAGTTWNRIATEPAQVGAEAGWNNSFMILGTDMWFGTNNTRVYHHPTLGAPLAGWVSPASGSTLNTYAVHFNSGGATGLGLAGGGAVTATSMVQSITGGNLPAYTTSSQPPTALNINGIEGNVKEDNWWCIRSGPSIYRAMSHGGAWATAYTQGTTVFQDIDFVIESGCAVGWAVGNTGNIARMEPAEFTKTLQLKACIEGYLTCPSTYIGDTVTVCIRDVTAGFPIIAIAKGKSDANCNLTVSFTDPIGLGPYYIVVKHKNSIETWSKAGGELWPANTLKYDFTTDASQAFGSNMVFKCGKWCIFSGDVNQDGVVDLSDLGLIDNDAFNFVTGYVVTDLNCDGVVDLSDAAIADNNAFNFVTVITP